MDKPNQIDKPAAEGVNARPNAHHDEVLEKLVTIECQLTDVGTDLATTIKSAIDDLKKHFDASQEVTLNAITNLASVALPTSTNPHKRE